MTGYGKAYLPEKDSWLVVQLKSFVVIDHSLTEAEADRLLAYLQGVRVHCPIDAADTEKYAEVYAGYPRTGGGEEGLRILAKAKAPLPDVIAARDAYKNYVKTNRFEEKYIKRFPAWCRKWREWKPDALRETPKINTDDLGFKW